MPTAIKKNLEALRTIITSLNHGRIEGALNFGALEGLLQFYGSGCLAGDIEFYLDCHVGSVAPFLKSARAPGASWPCSPPQAATPLA
jgi:hypothetical protein